MTTSLIGRARELELVYGQLRLTEVRLLTLTGPGGVGKTRLAAEVAKRLSAEDWFTDGVHFIDLSLVDRPDQVLPAVRAALGVHESAGLDLGQRLITSLADRQMLIVLDNCEHVLTAVAAMGTLLVGCPGLKVLATSRESLRLRWERIIPLEPLAFADPDPRHLPPVAALAQVPSVALFLDRARAARPDFF